MLIIVLALVLAGGGVLFFTLRGGSGTSLVAINARLGRYGLLGPQASVQVALQHGPQRRQMSRTVERAVEKSPFSGPVVRKLLQADLKMTAAEWFSLCAAAFLIAMLFGLILKGILGMLVLGLVSAGAPWAYLRFRTNKRKRQFLEQLADMAQMMGNSMRAGFSIMQSMELVAQEGPSPSGQEFERVVTEVKLGLTLDVALEHLLERQPSEDLNLMVVAINVQRQVGGNLSEILAVIAKTIRERVRFQRDLKALTAQARYSSYIITGLPVGVAVVINFMDREYESYLYTAMLGRMMIFAALCMLGTGFFLLNKIANIEV